MINERQLHEVINKYQLSLTREKKNHILKYSEVTEINLILDYLINELKIDRKNIEKCPSILTQSLKVIKTNYQLLQEKQIFNYSIESCLHILGVKTEDLIDTYNYVSENYGEEILNSNTTILRESVDKIKEVETYLKGLVSDQVLIGACITNRPVEEMVEIVKICQREKVKLTSTMFKQSPKQVEEIIKTCRIYNIEITGSLFHKNAKELKELIN